MFGGSSKAQRRVARRRPHLARLVDLSYTSSESTDSAARVLIEGAQAAREVQ